MTMAPELPRGLQWLNAPATTLHEQRGRIVALAFVNSASAWCAQRLADLAVLSHDILTVPTPKILAAEVVMTIVGGQIVYERPK